MTLLRHQSRTCHKSIRMHQQQCIHQLIHEMFCMHNATNTFNFDILIIKSYKNLLRILGDRKIDYYIKQTPIYFILEGKFH